MTKDPAPTATEVAAALGAVITQAATAPDGYVFARLFGTPVASERRLGGLHVVPPAGPLTGLDIRPWTARTVGVVEVELPTDAVVTWAQLRDALPYGEFRVEPEFDPGPEVYSVAVEPNAGAPSGDARATRAGPAPDAAASVRLLVEVRAGLVGAITLRRDPPLP